MIITIDGPAGAGKSSVAKLVSQYLNFLYLDTGGIYRTMTLYLLRHNTDINDPEALKKALESIHIRYTSSHIYLNEQKVDHLLRTEAISRHTSDYSKNALIREFATRLQREIARDENVVLEGRDIGTVVFPNAEFKFFLTASDTIRGQRRYEELKKKDTSVSLDKIIENIKKRDENDMNREVAPLIKAKDAIEIDTSKLTIEQVAKLIVNHVKTEE
ncbi:MAG: (d)CMP kinase [Tissierellales bacterium]|nr:(d)CMP kinase [Tissierellales bacterium]MBN2828449.1 (d)CMP kinase [Tissierellales bacterium]